MKLLDYFLSNTDRPAIHKPMANFPVYEHYFQQFINRPVKVLEIGVENGGSLMMWRDYFGDKAEIIGVDINPRCKEFESERIRIYTGDQSDGTFISKLIENENHFDVIIDDGSHIPMQQVISLQLLFGHMNTPGIYLVEDIGTNYMPEYGGGLNIKSTFIEYSKFMVDIINEKPHFEFSDYCFAIHFHHDIIVFENQIVQKSDTRIIGQIRI